MPEIDRLWQKSGGPKLFRRAEPLVVAVCGNHDDGKLWAPLLDFAQQSQSIHAWHVYVRQDHDQFGAEFGDTAEAFLARRGEMQLVAAFAYFAAKALPKEFRHISFIVDNQNAETP